MTQLGTTNMIHDTLRLVLLEAADAYRALSEDASDAALDHLRNILEYAKERVGTTNEPSELQKAHNAILDVYSTHIPGYASIVEYGLRFGLYSFDMDVDDLIKQSLLDSRAMMKFVKRHGLQDRVQKVAAPYPFQEVGIEAVNIYPHDILAEVFGA